MSADPTSDPPPPRWVGRAAPPVPPTRPDDDGRPSHPYGDREDRGYEGPQTRPYDGHDERRYDRSRTRRYNGPGDRRYDGPPPSHLVYSPRRPRRPLGGGRAALLLVATLVGFCVLMAAVLASGLGRDSARASLGQAPPGIGTSVRDGAFQFVVTQVSCGHANVHKSLVTRTANGQFCLVSLTVTNISKDSKGFSEAFQRAYAPDGSRYSADFTAGVVANGNVDTVWKSVAPQATVSGVIVFDIPRTTSLARIDLHDSLLSGGVSVTM